MPRRAIVEPKVVVGGLRVTDDLTLAVTLSQEEQPDLAFVEVGLHAGAGLALVHHLKAVVPAVTVYALASRKTLEIAANAIALGGAGLIMMPPGGDEILTANETLKAKRADEARRNDLERASAAVARSAGWMGRVVELADSAGRTEAAEQLSALITEAFGEPLGFAVFTLAGDRPEDLSRASATDDLEHLPRLASDADLADIAARSTPHTLRDIPLVSSGTRVGRLLVSSRLGEPSWLTGW